jgi:hypothetical protein
MLIRYLVISKPGVVQGNCGVNSNVKVLEDLEKSTAGRVEYPPLKPFQCALVIDKPFFLNVNATLWLDSLYVALTRTRTQVAFAVLEDGGKVSPEERCLIITNSTFVGEGRGSTQAIFSDDVTTNVLIEGASEVWSCTCININFSSFQTLQMSAYFEDKKSFSWCAYCSVAPCLCSGMPLI